MPTRALAVRSLLVVVGLAAGVPAQDGNNAGDQKLPITSLTLYRSGVGYFERRAEVEGDQTVQLRFATDQINDILKSMVVLDLSGGRVDAVNYGSKESLERRLSSFGVDLSDDPPAGAILARLRGEDVTLTTREGEVRGVILNVETRPTVVGGTPDAAPAKYDLPWINLVSGGAVRSVNLTTVTGFEFENPALREEMNKALAAIAEHHADRVKTVDISLSGDGERTVAVAYVHEMPMWKTSYRLVLPEAAARGKDNQPFLQAWAIVENTTDEDWHDVQLSLVAGRPVSFEMDLYQPLHVGRPTLPVPMVPGVIARVYDESSGLADGVLVPGAPSAAPPSRAAGRARSENELMEDSKSLMREQMNRRDIAVTGGEKMKAGLSALSPAEFAAYSAQAQATGGDVGEVFQYTLESPVTLERQRSAMLPIIAQPIDGRRVSIYNRSDSAEHPMRGVELTNTTGLQLMPGPLSVFDGPAYAGDAQIGHVTTGDKRLLAYAVDVDVAARTRDDHRNTIQSARIVRGSIEITTKQQATVTYDFTNKDQKRPRTILVEQPRMDGWELKKPEKPSDETAGLYRFEVTLDAGKAASLPVVQERIDRQYHAVGTYDLNTILAYARDGKASQKVVDAVREAARLQAAHADAQQAVARLDQERQAIDQDQARIRQNMQSIARDTELYKRYTTKLNEQESRLEQLVGERAKAQAAVDAAKAAFDDYVRNLHVE